MNKMKIFFILSLFMITTSDSARILGAFTYPSLSHQIVFRSLMKELANRGHEVVMITPIPSSNKSENTRNFKEIDVSNVTNSVWDEYIPNKEEPTSPIQSVYHFTHIINLMAENQIKTTEVQNILKNEKEHFDLIFIEFCARTILSISLPYDVPVIEISSLGGYYDTFDLFGASVHPILSPTACTRRIHNLSPIEKIWELYIHYFSKYIYGQQLYKDDERIKRLFGPKAPNLTQLRKKIQLLYLNVHPLWDSNRAVSKNILYFDNLSEKPKKSLPRDLKSILDSSENGIIYVSFGNTFDSSSFSNNTISTLMKAFSKLNYDFLVRWNEGIVPGQPANVRLFKWFPQSDLLRHPKVKLFITQGGLQSTDEAITAGVPLIGIPFLGDQWQNVERYEIYQIGIYLSLKSLTENKLINAVNTVITDKRYRENVIRLRELMRDQPQSSRERGVLWTEYVLRNGFSPLLNAPAANMSWTVYYEIELVSYVLGLLLLFIGAMLYLMKIIFIRVKIILMRWYFIKYGCVIKNK